ncbi:MAG: phosphopentomutase [Ignavibacteriales bacterium]|nr:phosphopentomutase [Ignavibacteriales bacterium]
MKNFIVIILDGIGIGELPDARKYNDEGSNTLVNLANYLDGLKLPNFERMGLGNITEINGIRNIEEPIASYGKMNEISIGKDSITGHWEIGGINVKINFPLYPNGFPKDLVSRFKKITGVEGVLGNKVASGTEIIKELGDQHYKTGYPIIYTSADSVFQIAAHERIIPLENLYEICQIAREKVLVGDDLVTRVIARPFVGEEGKYQRTTSRKDFALSPIEDTILDVLIKNNVKTVAIGKINDLFNNRGIKVKITTKSNSDGVKNIINCCQQFSNSLIFANLVDFDVYYGHRNDPIGFEKALKEFDEQLPMILNKLDESDALVITSDHGNDPTTISTDHSREYVPLLFYRKGKVGRNLNIRETFGDVAQTIAHFFKINNSLIGTSFLN